MTARKKPGPASSRVKSEINWKDAVRRALQKKRPASGWPKPRGGKK